MWKVNCTQAPPPCNPKKRKRKIKLLVCFYNKKYKKYDEKYTIPLEKTEKGQFI